MAGTIVANTLNTDTGVFSTNNAYTGIAKAWVNFAGSGGAINQSFNVSSITVNGTGDYTINFATAMSNANYVVAGILQPTTSQGTSTYARCINLYYNSSPSTSSFRIQTTTGGIGQETYQAVGVVVFD